VNCLTLDSRAQWHRGPELFEGIGVVMQMHQIRYFLALCEECNFTRAAKRSGVSQPSLTNAIGALERELGGALFHRKPFIALTALGHAMQPYLRRIAETADHARETAQAFVRLPPVNAELAPHPQPSHSEHPSS
jgi:DNA-binding transcriptional LysR family regulator